MRAWPSIALPELGTEGLVADAAFVDGSHRFHEAQKDAKTFSEAIWATVPDPEDAETLDFPLGT